MAVPKRKQSRAAEQEELQRLETERARAGEMSEMRRADRSAQGLQQLRLLQRQGSYQKGSLSGVFQRREKEGLLLFFLEKSGPRLDVRGK